MGLPLAFAIIAGVYGAGAVSGGCFNPAVALGIDMSSSGLGFDWCAPRILFELAGATLADVLFEVVHPESFEDERTSATELVSEFLGTYILVLVLTAGLNARGKSRAAACSIAAPLTSMLYALGDVFGAHFNPAVTVATLASGHLTPAKAGTFIGAQSQEASQLPSRMPSFTRQFLISFVDSN